MPSCGYPEKSAGLRLSLIFPTAAPTHAPFICHRQRSRVLPGTPRVQVLNNLTKTNSGCLRQPLFALAGAEGLEPEARGFGVEPDVFQVVFLSVFMCFLVYFAQVILLEFVNY